MKNGTGSEMENEYGQLQFGYLGNGLESRARYMTGVVAHLGQVPDHTGVAPGQAHSWSSLS